MTACLIFFETGGNMTFSDDFKIRSMQDLMDLIDRTIKEDQERAGKHE